MSEPFAGEVAVEDQRENEAEQKLKDERSEGPPERVGEGAEKVPVAGELMEMLEADKTAAQGVEQPHVAECIGEPERQRHQHHRDDQDDGRRSVEVWLQSTAEPAPRRMAAKGEGGCRYGAVGHGRRPPQFPSAGAEAVVRSSLTAAWTP